MGTDDGSKSTPKSDFLLWLLRARRWAIATSSTAASSPKLSIWGSGSLAFLLLLLFLLSGDDADLDGQQRSSSGHRQLIAAGFLDDDGHGGGNAPLSEEAGMVTVSFHCADSRDGSTRPILLKFHADGEFSYQAPGRRRGKEGGRKNGEEDGVVVSLPFGIVEAGDTLTVFTNPNAVWSAWRPVVAAGSAAAAVAATAEGAPEEQLLAIWRVREATDGDDVLREAEASRPQHFFIDSVADEEWEWSKRAS